MIRRPRSRNLAPVKFETRNADPAMLARYLLSPDPTLAAAALGAVGELIDHGKIDLGPKRECGHHEQQICACRITMSPLPFMLEPMTGTAEVHASLRAWAKGLLALEAAVELLIAADGGRWAEPGQPWIRQDEQGRWWVNWDVLVVELGVLSGGERRFLSFVASLADDHPVKLGDAVTGVDHDHLHLMLAGIAHAGGNRQWQPL